MIKVRYVFFLLSLLLIITACASSPAASAPAKKVDSNAREASFFHFTPDRNGLVFIGAAGKQSKEKDSLRLALEDAARQVALFYSVFGEYAVRTDIGTGLFDYSRETATTLLYDEEGSSQYVESLQYDPDTDTILIENGFFVRATYPLTLSAPVSYRPKYSGADRKPDWVTHPPNEIAGYEVGISYSGRHSYLSDAYKNSRYNAVYSIIRSVNTSVRGTSLSYEVASGGSFGYKAASNNVNYSYGTLNGFYVLDTWIDPKSRAVWTLAIADRIK